MMAYEDYLSQKVSDLQWRIENLEKELQQSKEKLKDEYNRGWMAGAWSEDGEQK